MLLNDSASIKRTVFFQDKNMHDAPDAESMHDVLNSKAPVRKSVASLVECACGIVPQHYRLRGCECRICVGDSAAGKVELRVTEVLSILRTRE